MVQVAMSVLGYIASTSNPEIKLAIILPCWAPTDLILELLHIRMLSNVMH